MLEPGRVKKPSGKFKVLLYIPFPISDLMKMPPSLSLPYAPIPANVNLY